MDEKIPPKALKIIPLTYLAGLILAIIGDTNSNFQNYHPNVLVKTAMGIFLAVFPITLLLSAWLFYQIYLSMRKFQRKLFAAIALSAPFYLVRLVYSAIGDFGSSKDFAVGSGNVTIYLCMSVLEEIISIAIVVGLGYSAMRGKDYVKPTAVAREDLEGASSRY